MELWDLYDEQRRPLHRTHVRGLPMRRGEYHLVAFVWIFNSRGELLLTRRAPEKRKYPNFWSLTGGSAIAGETSLQAVRRELFEETGLQAEESEFLLLETFRDGRKLYFSDTYFLRKDAALEELVMQPGETSEARWVGPEELQAMIEKGQVAPPDVQRLHQLKDKLAALLQTA